MYMSIPDSLHTKDRSGDREGEGFPQNEADPGPLCRIKRRDLWQKDKVGGITMSKKPYIIDEAAGLTSLRDPMILVVGDTYYLTGTQNPIWKGPNEGVRLWSSKDLVHFTNHSFRGLDGKDYITFHAFMRDKNEEALPRIFIRQVEYLPDGTVKVFA